MINTQHTHARKLKYVSEDERERKNPNRNSILKAFWVINVVVVVVWVSVSVLWSYCCALREFVICSHTFLACSAYRVRITRVARSCVLSFEFFFWQVTNIAHNSLSVIQIQYVLEWLRVGVWRANFQSLNFVYPRNKVLKLHLAADWRFVQRMISFDVFYPKKMFAHRFAIWQSDFFTTQIIQKLLFLSDQSSSNKRWAVRLISTFDLLPTKKNWWFLILALSVKESNECENQRGHASYA